MPLNRRCKLFNPFGTGISHALTVNVIWQLAGSDTKCHSKWLTECLLDFTDVSGSHHLSHRYPRHLHDPSVYSENAFQSQPYYQSPTFQSTLPPAEPLIPQQPAPASFYSPPDLRWVLLGKCIYVWIIKNNKKELPLTMLLDFTFCSDFLSVIALFSLRWR